MSIADRIKKIRGELTILQFSEELSKFGTNIDRGNLSRYENGKIKPSTDFYIAVSKLGYNVNWLLTGRGNILQNNYDIFSSDCLKVAEENQSYNLEDERIKILVQKEVEKILKNKQ